MGRITISGLPFWQWYGTRLVWNTIGNDYCPFCEVYPVALWLFVGHFAVGVASAYAVFRVTGGHILSAALLIVLGGVGVLATRGFLEHLGGWQEATEEMVQEAADEHDLDVERIPTED